MGDTMHVRNLRRVVIALCATSICVTSICASTSARAFEKGFPAQELIPGITINATAAAPPPGIYMFNQAITYQPVLVGPGAPSANGKATPVPLNGAAVGVLFVPGWSFLGATYDAVLVQAVAQKSFGPPVNTEYGGLHNTYIVPVELSWKLSDSGFYVKSGLGISVPTGEISGPSGLGNFGNPWYTFHPSLYVSYLKDGWILTANMSMEINTKNTITDYQGGNILHADLAALRRFGKWTLGPVGYYYGQISDDKSSAFYNGAINVNRFDVWAAGGLLGYDFGPAALNLWAVDEFYANASGGTPVDKASVTQGWKVFASLSYRLWAPEEAPKTPAAFFRK